MTLLVVGDGAEGAQDALGRAVVELGEQGHDAVGLDVRAAGASVLHGDPLAVVRWAVAHLRPRVVVVVDHDEDWGSWGLDLPTGSKVVTAGREVAIEGLVLFARGADAGADRPAPVRDLLAVLAGTDDPDRIRVRDRGPRVSVLVAFYNLAHFTHEVVQSVLDQDHDDFELVALDDGSDDGTAAILADYGRDPRVRIITQPNIGGTGRMDLVCNELARAARGELLAFQGGDDVSLPERLRTQVEAFDEDPGIGVCHSGAFIENVETGRMHLGFRPGRAYDEFSLLRELLRENAVGHPSVMMRRDVWLRHGAFEEGLSADLHFWLKTASRERFRYLPQPLVRYRIHDKSLSTSESGITRTTLEGVRLREQALQRLPLEEFFPELEGVADRTVRAEAWTALGNSLVQTVPRLARTAYAHAVEDGFVDALHNTAIAQMLEGETDAALVTARRARSLDPSAQELLNVVSGAADASVVLRSPLDHVTPVVAAARRRQADQVIRWDGTPLSVNTAYLGFVPERLDVFRAGLAAWSTRTRQSDPLRWVVPTLGRGLPSVLEDFQRAVQGLDLDGAADIVLEQIDALMLLPPGDDVPGLPSSGAGGRIEGVLTDDIAVEGFEGWLGAHARAFLLTL